MNKYSNPQQNATIGEILNQQRAERDELGETLLQALHDAIPWGLTIDLGLGRRATLKSLGGAYRQEIYPRGDASVVADPEKTLPKGSPELTFDFSLENCDQDHVEVTVEITGGGGCT